MNTRKPAIGISFPINRGTPFSTAELRDWLRAAEEAGYDYVSIGDHLLGMDAASLSPSNRDRWQKAYPGAQGTAYGVSDIFREPMMIGAFFAGLGTRLGLATGVVPLPQRQTVVFAKQAAELDNLCAGRLRLGVGAGWNPLEFEALGADFVNRGAVLDEQLVLLRRLWTESVVTFEGVFHRIEGSGIQIMPLQRPIPVWLGGDGRRTLERVGRLADGWHPAGRVMPGVQAADCLAVIRAAAQQAKRDPSDIGLEVRIFADKKTPDDIHDFVRSWSQHEPTMFCVTAGDPLAPTILERHVAELRAVAETLRRGSD